LNQVELMQQLAAVAMVLGLLGAVLWLLQRNRLSPFITLAGRKVGTKQLEVVERVALSPQHSLALVRVNGVTMLVGTGPGVCEIRNVETAS
jgi:flagellar biogenesis protein FliO